VKPEEIKTKLAFGSPMHRKVAEAVRTRLKMSEKKMANRYQQMAKNEELFQSYIPERDVDAVRRSEREQSGVPDYRTIEIPYSYAQAMTAHTYYTSVFLTRNPILQLSGRHGEAEQNTQAFEAMLAYQMTVGMNALPMFIWLLDPAKYGYGVIGHYWDREITRIRRVTEEPVTFLGTPIEGAKPRKVYTIEDVPGYEGNRVYNVRAQDFFPDPRVPLVHFQRGEFCSRYVEIPWNEIYEGQQSGRYFNYERLKAARDGSSDTVPGRDTGSERVTDLPGTEGGADEGQSEIPKSPGYEVPVGFVKSHEVYIKITPKDWYLDDSTRQEIWVFNITSNGVIFGCVPLGEYHNKFPFDLLLDEVDGYTLFPKSMMERMKPLNDVLTWLINSHFYNVRASLNNQFIYDPSMLVSRDLENPDPGKLIRLKPEAYGRDVRSMLMQIPVQDITRSNISDFELMKNIIQWMTGVSDPVMGMLNSGGRKTATEARISTSFGVNRLKTQCEWYSTIGFSPMTQKLVQRTQQNYDQPKKFRLVGDLGQLAPTFAEVTPDMIAGFYDFEPVDGTLPVDRFAQANLWQMLMGQLQNYPQILATYDIAKIFAWVANLAGVKNISQFRVVPDQQLLGQAQAGNVVPISQAMRDAGRTNLNEPAQVPAVGPTG
jgi:hypothetical protein